MPNALATVKILYVEDDLDTREELHMILKFCVGEVFVAANGREGLEMYKSCRPDIVITDIQMPELNGLAMASEIKKCKKDQVIVLLSAHDDEEYFFRAKELGIGHYIIKPINVEYLLAKLNDIVEQGLCNSNAAMSLGKRAPTSGCL